MTFVPRRLQERQIKHAQMQAALQRGYSAFGLALQACLTTAQGLTVTDPQEQVFVDLLQHLRVRSCSKSFGYQLIQGANRVAFDYDYRARMLFCDLKIVWSNFKPKNASRTVDKQYMTSLVEKYLGFKPIVIDDARFT